MKAMGLLHKETILPKLSILTIIYKTFTRSRLDYTNFICDQAYIFAFHDKRESVQCNGCLAITGVIWGTSSEKLYQELGLESLKSRRWYRKLCHFYKIFDKKLSFYIINLIPNLNRVDNTRLTYNILPIKKKLIFFLLLYQSGTSLILTLETQ